MINFAIILVHESFIVTNCKLSAFLSSGEDFPLYCSATY